MISCSKKSDVTVTTPEVEKLKSKYGLLESPPDNTPISYHFKSVEEATLFLNRTEKDLDGNSILELVPDTAKPNTKNARLLTDSYTGIFKFALLRYSPFIPNRPIS